MTSTLVEVVGSVVVATSFTLVQDIPPIGHREAMTIADTETKRLLAVVDQLEERDWSRRTDCIEWDVKALLSHMLGSLTANASVFAMVRQLSLGIRASRRTGRPMLDEVNARHVADHADKTPAELVRALHRLGPKAVQRRRRTPAIVRAMKIRPGPPVDGKVSLGELVGVVLNLDMWMHRTDLTRATGREHELTAQHDGRIVADIVAAWARLHGQPFTLTLDGPAGGAFRLGVGGPDYHLDAVELCRILSGRAPGFGLLLYSRFRPAPSTVSPDRDA